jgi:NAD(P)-dependent dehydrogenase (short-subunit alcohol dehydrogenase family)/acyl carrier protein
MAQARHMGKLVLSIAPSAADATPVRADGAYLISGGFGGVGLGAARWLAERGARRLVLIGRGGPDANAAEAIEALVAQGVEIQAVAADIADGEAMAGVIAKVTAQGPLRGIIHAAGASHNGLVRDLDAADISAVRRGKVQGAQVLRASTKGLALDFVVLCTAAANLFGASGQGAYAAANAELEALGAAWRRDGTPVSSIAWGPWRDAGMFAAMNDRAQAAWIARGLIPMTEAEAFAALDRAIAGEVRQALAAKVDWARALADDGARWNLALFAAMQPKTQPRTHAGPSADKTAQDGLAALRAMPPALRRNALVEAIAVRARTVLDLPKGSTLPSAVALKDLGLDSLMAVELRNHLARFGGIALPATLAFDHPTLDALADRLSVIWSLQASPEAAPISAAAAEDDLEGLDDEDIEALLAAELNQMSEGAPS